MFSNVSSGGGGLFGNRTNLNNIPPNNFSQQTFFGQFQGPSTSIDHVGMPFTTKNRDGYLVASITASMNHLSLEELRINDHFAVKRGQIPDNKKQSIENLIQNNIRKRDDPASALAQTPSPSTLFAGSTAYPQTGGIFAAPQNIPNPLPTTAGGLFAGSNPPFANQTVSSLGAPFGGFGSQLPQNLYQPPTQTITQGAPQESVSGLFANKPANPTEAPISGSLFSNSTSSPQQGVFGLKSPGAGGLFSGNAVFPTSTVPSSSLFSNTAPTNPNPNTSEVTALGNQSAPKISFLGQASAPTTTVTSSVFGHAVQQGNFNAGIKPVESLTKTEVQPLATPVEAQKIGPLFPGAQAAFPKNTAPVNSNTTQNQQPSFLRPQIQEVKAAPQLQQSTQNMASAVPSLPQSQTVSSKPGGYAYEMNKMLFTSSLVELFEEHNIVYPPELLEETDFMPRMFEFLATYGIKPPTKFVPKFKMNKAAILSVVAPEDREAMREQEMKAQEVESQQKPVVVRAEVNNEKEEEKQGMKKPTLFKVVDVYTKKEEKNEKEGEESEKEESAVVVGEGSHEENGSESQGQQSTENQ